MLKTFQTNRPTDQPTNGPKNKEEQTNHIYLYISILYYYIYYLLLLVTVGYSLDFVGRCWLVGIRFFRWSSNQQNQRTKNRDQRKLPFIQ